MPSSTTVMVAELESLSLTAELSAWTLADLGSVNMQVSKSPITKSDSVESMLVEERVSAMKVEKQGLRPRAVRFTPTSRNSPGKATFPGVPLLLVKDQGSVTFAPLTIAN